MKPTPNIGPELTEWLTLFVRAASALPFGSTPRPIRCRFCGASLDGIALGLAGIVSQKFKPMCENKGGVISFWVEPTSEPVLHRSKPFNWRCRDCKREVKLVPPQKLK